MNQVVAREENALVAGAAVTALEHYSAASLILGPSWDRIQQFGKLMARGAATIPEHFRGKEADCTAIAMQALGWGMNPWAVAQKTHITKSGAIGYDAQLVNAVIQASGELDTAPDYEYIGDWSKVLGKVEERTSDKGGKYFVATYTKKDEEGLGVRVKARLRGEDRVRELEVLMSQAYPRFSTQWATDPRQQISYLALRKFVRLHKPGVLLGVYTADELESAPPPEKFMGNAEVMPANPPAAPTYYADESFTKNLPAWKRLIESGKKTVDDIIAMVSSKATLTESQLATLRELQSPPEPEPKKETVPFDQVVKKLEAATDPDLLDAAADLIRMVDAEGERQTLTELYNERKAALTGGAK